MCLNFLSGILLVAIGYSTFEQSHANTGNDFGKALIGKKLTVEGFKSLSVMSTKPYNDQAGTVEWQLFGDNHEKGLVSILMVPHFESLQITSGPCLVSYNGVVATTNTICAKVTEAINKISKGKDNIDPVVVAAGDLDAANPYELRGDDTIKTVGRKLRETKKIKIGAVDWDVSGASSVENSRLSLDSSKPHRLLFVAKHDFGNNKHASILAVVYYEGNAFKVQSLLYAENGVSTSAPADPAIRDDATFKTKIVDGVAALLK